MIFSLFPIKLKRNVTQLQKWEKHLWMEKRLLYPNVGITIFFMETFLQNCYFQDSFIVHQVTNS